MTMEHFLPAVFTAGFIILGISAVLCLWRMLKGPTQLDRVMAVDTFSLNVLCFMVVWCVSREDLTLLDPVLALAMVGFISTVAMAKFLERGQLID